MSRPARQPAPVTIGASGLDGSVITWSREDEADDLELGQFAGTPSLVDAATALIFARQPFTLPNGVQWSYLPSPRLRVDDVAATILAVLEVDADVTLLDRADLTLLMVAGPDDPRAQ